MPSIDLQTFRFAEPVYLWLLVVPAILLFVWAWRVVRRRADIKHLAVGRVVPIRERPGIVGDLAFWVCVLLASILCIGALAQPQARVSSLRTASADIVMLLDASASMYVTDVKPNRWRRSVEFLRTIGEALSWQGDRVALALFAQLAAPQVRLTKDPNALFFFIDHLGDTSPFLLENATTWDTNIEEGIRWGLRVVEIDEEIFGKSGNPKAFVVISDGQAWSGTVAVALKTARERQIPVYVVGIGTTTGGMIPEPAGPDGKRPPPTIHSVLDRNSLVQLAVAGGGEYFEIGPEPDRVVAFRIIDHLRRRFAGAKEIESFDELYQPFLMSAAIVLCVGTVFLRSRVQLLWQAAAALAATLLLANAIGF